MQGSCDPLRIGLDPHSHTGGHAGHLDLRTQRLQTHQRGRQICLRTEGRTPQLTAESGKPRPNSRCIPMTLSCSGLPRRDPALWIPSIPGTAAASVTPEIRPPVPLGKGYGPK